ncbi:hypothetical protein GUITHDRAFT_165278 [Guillardia theta CCMP2712]|uniref:Uncharacterized protein n=1 Tax=Guillardia theta (strain CCMP2712) TaxID=905079 RepID=L1IPV1_GUITC|nr:hypothetical protein GUITHDRAFT_165278 [Guillardia theta CCMP2712]EKX38127.1 hypothetical protein GUITHDRAFT_165278 [Guillardia theta CCMP2712]|mmetsp:Transcript_20981/g.69978  ORF Transcript_20981/g.69978 Transcript_20981/m.69978 type:complete len:456 (-) Transcript_20981:1083-2450(-)|eukprot:XP_005825107.1 hypothetical protein GUITHDRAFT_165278 [Guillardia theta CCMP2712]
MSSLPPYQYTLAEKTFSEFVGCFIVSALSLGLVVNHHLPGTKGHGYEYGFIALGFGLSFIFPMVMLNHISARLNPASMVALWVAGLTPFSHAVVMSIAQVIGWFCGSVLVFGLYLPHFSTVPKPPKEEEDDDFAMRRSAGPKARQIASATLREETDFKRACSSPFKMNRSESIEQRKLRSLETLAHKLEEKLMKKNLPADMLQRYRREKTIEIAVTQQAIRQLSGSFRVPTLEEIAIRLPSNGECKSQASSERELKFDPNGKSCNDNVDNLDENETMNERLVLDTKIDEEPIKRKITEKMAKLNEEYAKALHADKRIKLASFGTTPAIPNFFFNAIQEFTATAFLTWGNLMMAEKAYMMPPEERTVYTNVVVPALIGPWIFVLILAFGGNINPSMNPARDLGPRIAHTILPVPGKGPSDWWYAPCIYMGELAGGAMGGFLYLMLNSMNHSQWNRT